MNGATVELTFSDGEILSFAADKEGSLLEVAQKSGIRLASDCMSGICQTCKCELREGEVAYDNLDEIALEERERMAGAVLPCQARAISDVVKLQLPYTRASQFPQRTRKLLVTSVGRISDNVFELRGRCQGGRMFPFLSGQYVNITVPGTDAIRSYSMMTSPGQEEIGFLIRSLPRGAMSGYLSSSARVGDVLQMTGPFGTFYRRGTSGPRIMVAGGTGLAPILSILRDIERQHDTGRPVVIAFGVTSDRDAFYGTELEALKSSFSDLTVLTAAVSHGDQWRGRTGTAVDLLDDELPGLNPDATAYLCGPPAMIDSARDRLCEMGLDPSRIFSEKFQPTGA